MTVWHKITITAAILSMDSSYLKVKGPLELLKKIHLKQAVFCGFFLIKERHFKVPLLHKVVEMFKTSPYVSKRPTKVLKKAEIYG